MKKGQIVAIYFDPMTGKDTRGRAMLVEKVGELGAGIEYWEVELLSNKSRVRRAIKVAG